MLNHYNARVDPASPYFIALLLRRRTMLGAMRRYQASQTWFRNPSAGGFCKKVFLPNVYGVREEPSRTRTLGAPIGALGAFVSFSQQHGPGRSSFFALQIGLNMSLQVKTNAPLPARQSDYVVAQKSRAAALQHADAQRAQQRGIDYASIDVNAAKWRYVSISA
jgi:hypothetical protein